MRGQIRKRGRTSWAVIVYLGRDPDSGKERRKWFTHRRREDAERHLSQLLNQLYAGGSIPTTRKFMGEWLEEWLRGHAPHLAATTEMSYGDTIRKHLIPNLGHYPLTKLSPQAVRDYQATKLASGLSTTTVRYHLMILKEALGQAVQDGLVLRNPADLVKAPPKRRREMRVLDEEQVRLFLGEAKRSSPYYRLYLAAITTGMRQGELLGLRWQDVDLAFGRASVQQTFYRLSGQQLFKPPKTAKSRRTVPLASFLVEEIRALHEEQAEQKRLLGPAYEDHGLVFCQSDGKPLHAHNIAQRDLRRVLALEGLRTELRTKGVPEESLPKGLPRIRFHDLRHTAASLLLQQGVHPKVVQERLGHASIAMTLDIYSHIVPGMQEEAVRNLEMRLFGLPKGGVEIRSPGGPREGKASRPQPISKHLDLSGGS